MAPIPSEALIYKLGASTRQVRLKFAKITSKMARAALRRTNPGHAAPVLHLPTLA